MILDIYKKGKNLGFINTKKPGAQEAIKQLRQLGYTLKA